MPVTRKTGQRHRVSDTSGGREMKSPIHLPLINETVPLAGGADEFSGFAAGRAGPGRDRPGVWLQCAAGGLCVLAAAAAAVSFTAQYRLVYAARRLALIAGL